MLRNGTGDPAAPTLQAIRPEERQQEEEEGKLKLRQHNPSLLDCPKAPGPLENGSETSEAPFLPSFSARIALPSTGTDQKAANKQRKQDPTPPGEPNDFIFMPVSPGEAAGSNHLGRQMKGSCLAQGHVQQE